MSDLDDFNNDPKKNPKKSVSADPNDVRALIAGYNKPLRVIDEIIPETPQSETTDSGKLDKSKYYVRGAKKGQLKPEGSQGVRVSSNRSAEDGTVSGAVITAGLFLLIVDTVFPIIIVILNNRFSEKKMKAEVLKLTNEQKKELEPIAEQVLKQIQMTGNPTAILLLTFAGLYAANYAMAKANE